MSGRTGHTSLLVIVDSGSGLGPDFSVIRHYHIIDQLDESPPLEIAITEQHKASSTRTSQPRERVRERGRVGFTIVYSDEAFPTRWRNDV